MRNTSVTVRSLATTALALTAGLGAVTVTATPASAAVAGGMEPTPVSTPAAPYGVRTTCVWSNAVRVTWSRGWFGTAGVSGYEVGAFYTSGTLASSRTVSSWSSQADVNRLRSGTRYQFKVRAKNSAGWGAWSKSVYATTSRY
ncbi:fibronectin type III domain-containing protein [Pilimelia columellifera]|uniref:Fibronectin type-III domain-containing protein n=1 Tax=Pilimelia columellifera subsp. columellifera TaxID=706583 RepID=A0ABN3NLL1_9ACTN